MPDEEKVFSVDSINLTLNKSNPPQLVIKSSGTCSTGGWSNGRLSEFVYVVPPADGMQEYDFVAQPPKPGTSVTQALSPISAEHMMHDMPIWVRGVRIYASSNEAEKTI